MSDKISLGTAEIDIQELLRTRLLLQANSGGGKSWAIRRCSEELFGRVPLFIIDPEGEFSTIREKFDFVLVGPGGETPADPNTASIVAEKLLELKVSAVLDIYELKPPDRHRWVRGFLEALVDAPKSLWHPRIVVVDEAHIFCMDTATEILTPDGWKKWDEVKAGQEVVSFDLETSTYRNEVIKRVIVKNYEGEMVLLKSDGIDCLVTPEHRVVYSSVQRAKARYGKVYGPSFREASSLPRHIQIPIGGGPIGDGIKGLSEDICYAIGFVATDGYFCGSGKGGVRKSYLSIQQAYVTTKGGINMVERLSEVSARLGGLSTYEIPPRLTKSPVDGSLMKCSKSKVFYFGKEVSSEILKWTGQEIHRIPRKILTHGSRKQLLALLDGLLHGDGTCSKPHWGYKGWNHFYPGNDEGLADDFQELCIRLGISASKTRGPQTGQWTVLLSKRKSHYIRKTNRKMYSGIVWDITVPSGAFVARRNGKVFVTGNCPEKGMGESEASGAMIDLATRGRKRGICPILATQRLSKLAKNATAELLNRLVGPTFEDLDLNRAADLLSVSSSEREAFYKEMKTLRSGVFYGLGRAISKERIRIEIGPVQTTHPEMGATGYVHAPTPTPEKIKALLDKLDGIPKIAEERRNNEEALRAEIVKLRAELATKPKTIEVSGGVAASEREVAVIKGAELARLEMAFDKMERFALKFESVSGVLRAFTESLKNEVKRIEKGIKGPAIKPVVLEAPDDEDDREELPKILDIPDPNKPIENNSELKGVHKAILKALCDFKKIGITVVPRSMLAGWLDVDPDGGSFLNNIGKLKNLSLIDTFNTPGGEKGQKLTDEGSRQAPLSDLDATPDGVFRRVRELVANPQKAILDICKEKYPAWITREDLANTLGLQVSGSFTNNLGELRKKMVVEYGVGEKKNQVKLADWTIMGTVAGE